MTEADRQRAAAREPGGRRRVRAHTAPLPGVTKVPHRGPRVDPPE